MDRECVAGVRGGSAILPRPLTLSNVLQGVHLHQPNDPEPREGEHDLCVFVCVCVSYTCIHEHRHHTLTHVHIDAEAGDATTTMP